MRNDLLNELAQQLKLLTESSDKYVDDGAWIEALTDDIRNAKALLKRYERAKKGLEMISAPAREPIL